MYSLKGHVHTRKQVAWPGAPIVDSLWGQLADSFLPLNFFTKVVQGSPLDVGGFHEAISDPRWGPSNSWAVAPDACLAAASQWHRAHRGVLAVLHLKDTHTAHAKKRK